MSIPVLVGIDAEVQSGLYGGVSPITYEEGGTNGFGVRMTPVRRYRNWFTQPFTGGSIESGFFSSGHLLVISVSNPTISPGPSDFTHKKLAAGTYDTDINDMFDRMAALAYDANVTSMSRSITTTNSSATVTGTFTGADVGATISGTNIQSSTTILSQTGTAAVMSKTATGSGAVTSTIIQGLTQPYIDFIYNHEQDAKGPDGQVGKFYYSNGWKASNTAAQNGTKDTATDFINAWIHLWNRWVARAAVAGVPTSRVRFCWNMTAFGFVPDRITQYWPGNQYVDDIGADCYWKVSTTFDAAIAGARKFAIAHNKPLCMPEFNGTDGTADSSARVTSLAAAATSIANETQCNYTFLNFWIAPDNGPLEYMNFNKVSGASLSSHSFPLVHGAIGSFITTLGSNGIRTATSQADPTQPHILTVTSNAAGTQITVTWDNPPVGDNITGWNVAIAAGSVGSGIPKVNPSPLSAATRTYTFTQLASGIALGPGSDYSVQVIALNAGVPAGQASSVVSFVTTNQPGPNTNSPIISVQSALNDPANANQINFILTATSPLSRPLTITHSITGPSGFTETFTGATASRTYTTSGSYIDNITVVDNAVPANATTTSLQFQIPLISGSTPNLGLALPPSQLRYNGGLGDLLRGNFQTIDGIVSGVAGQSLSAWNVFYNLAGSSFDPIGATSTAGGSASVLLFDMVRLESTSFSGVVVLVASPTLTGTGVHIGIHDSSGAVLTDSSGNTADYSGSAVDTWLTGTADTPKKFTLPAPITNRTFGEFLYVSVYLPSTVSIAPNFYAATASSTPAISTLATAPTTRYGQVTSYNSGIPTTIPFASADYVGPPVWFGLLP